MLRSDSPPETENSTPKRTFPAGLEAKTAQEFTLLKKVMKKCAPVN
jgi:hypothetical protein